MAEVGLDGFLVSCPVEDTFHTHAANRRYLSGFTGSMGTLLIAPEQAFIAADFRYYEQAERESPGFVLWKANGGADKWFAELIGEAGLEGKTVGFSPGDYSVTGYNALTKVIEGMPEERRPKLKAAPPLVEQIRAFKEPEEVDALQRAVDLGDQAFVHVAQRVEPGWTEKQLAWEIEKYARENGAEALSFNTIVAGGPWGAMPHAQPRERAIEAGEPIVIDMGVILDGYCSDLTRTIVVGEPDEEFKRIYDIVLTAQLTAEELVEQGMTGDAAHMLAHNVIEEAGYGDKFGHGLGHGVGIQVHELPRLSRTAPDVLEDGMVFTVEPGIYIPGWGGIRIEDMAVMENGKARVLTTAPKTQPREW
jgi:Xaa-Pro aminopeptidase